MNRWAYVLSVFCLPLILCVLVPGHQTAVHIYVSPQGDDTNPGIQTQPVATLAQAIRMVQKQRTNPGDPATIELGPGTYPLKHSVLLNGISANLTLKATTPGTARLFGGRVLSTWHAPDDATKARLSPSAAVNVLQADLPADFDASTMERRGFNLPRKQPGAELFFSGKPMPMASYPNLGNWIRIAPPVTKTSFGFSDDHPKTWKPSDDIWVLGYWNYDWAESYEKVTTLDPDKNIVDLSPINPPYEMKPGRRFRFLNVLEELDSPGEWYLDRTTNTLDLWPPTAIATSEAYVSELKDTLVQIVDTHDVNVDGLVIEGGRNGGVEVQNSNHIVISNCLIRNVGTFGAVINGSTDSGIKGCDLTGMGEEGIALVGGDRKTLTPGRLFAEDNHIWAYSRWRRTYQAGISLSGVGNRASYNEIHDAPHNAILISGNDELVEFNYIHDVCTETGDSGAVYMGRDPTMRGTIIRYNRFESLKANVQTQGNDVDVNSVYLDDGWSGTTIQGNLFLSQGTGVLIGGGRDNKVSNNIFVGNHPGVSLDARIKAVTDHDEYQEGNTGNFLAKVRAMNADQPPYSTHYPELANLLNDDPKSPKGTQITRNVSVGGQWLRLHNDLKESDFVNTSNVVDQTGTTLADALKELPLGFEPIPIDQIGLVTKAGRPSWPGDSK